MIKLPQIFSDGMVLSKTAKVWGQATPNLHISAKFLDKDYETISDITGRFEFIFTAEEFGGPHTLTIEDTIIKDVFIGRVWLCGGQSNMEGPLSRMRLNFGEHIIDDPRIRTFQVEKGHCFDGPRKDVVGEWNTAEGEFLDNMYAVPYFFARTLLEKYDCPIGLVCTPAGGTPIEGWLPEKIVREHTNLAEKLTQVKAHGYVESTTAESEKKVAAWHSNLHAEDIGLQKDWHEKTYDDSKWQTRALLDPTGTPDYGVIWLRKQFTVDEIRDDFILNFGRLENSCTVYVNGTEVVSIGYMYPPCRCKIPEGLLEKGENTIAVRIVGDSNRPYVVPGKEYAILSKSGGNIDLNKGLWKWCVGAEAEKSPEGVSFYDRPVGVYNYMLAPVLGYSVDGLIWYQGESNTGNPHSYMNLFKAFVTHIRSYYEDLPIIFTQVANYMDPFSYPFVGGFGAPGAYWAILREQQRQCLTLPNTAMAVTIDCGEYNDLHPKDKKTVGERLALHARRMVYGENIVSDGPTFEKVEYIKSTKSIVVHFKNAEGLWAKGGHPTMLVLFKDSSVHSVFCAIDGNKLISPAGALEPKAVRYGWADCPSVAIYNAYGLPASPFEEVIRQVGY